MKKYLMGFLAVVLAIGFSAFTKPAKAPKALDGEKWFHFFGSNSSEQDLQNVDKYELDNGTGSAATVCTSSDDYMCEIKILPQSGDPSKPDLTATVVEERGRPAP